MATTDHNLQYDGDSHMADQSLNFHTPGHVQPSAPPPAGQDPHIVTPPAPPHLSQGPLPGLGNMSFGEHIAQHASTHQPFVAPSTSPFVVPPVESVPPAPSVQWQPNPPPQPLHNQAVPRRPAQPSKSNCNPPQAQRFSAPAIKAPMPARSRETEDDDSEFGRARKRLRDDQFKPVEGPAPAAQSSVQASTSTANANAALAEATRQLAQPRDPANSSSGGPANTQQSNLGVANRDDLEGVCQSEKDEIMRNLYEGNIEDENGPDMRQMYRLVEKVFLKQDAILRGLRQPRSTPNGRNGSSQPESGPSQPTHGPGPSGNRPLRTSPHQPPKKVNWDQTVPSTEPAGRQPRLARRILIQKEIRLLIMRLLKLKSYNPPLPPAPVDARFPTTDTFGIRWDEKERSIFNMLAANVVVEELCRAWQHDRLTASEKEEVPDMVREHIRYLCRIHNDALKPDAPTLKKAQLKSASASSRRQTLYESRLKVLDRFPEALMKHRNLIIRLGLQGTSSDEEDPTQRKVYLIKRHKELSSRVQVLKSKLDLVYNLWFKGPGSRGSQMHVRVPSDKVSKRPIKVEGLPITCLNRAWLRSLSVPEREFYHFEGHLYDYSFPDELLNRNVGRTPNSIVLSEDEAA
ncbi:hypothetical protein FS749_012809 [Ceratobasidium sp. UAMH 11750]|nr:hypothetical protein FS749_012809 [Ceratobasidium sp. UAMH 11750]